MSKIQDRSHEGDQVDVARAHGAVKTLSLADVVRLVRRHQLLLASTVLLVSAVFVTVALLSKPVYRASVVVLPAAADRQGGIAASLLGQLGGLAALGGLDLQSQDAGIEESIAVLQSREFTERFITDKQLLPILYSSRWNDATQSWKGDESDWPTTATGARLFDGEVRTVIRDRKTGLFKVQITWSDPQLAADWANDLVDMLNMEMRRRAIARSDESVSYLEREFAATKVVATQEAIGRLIEHQVRNRMLAQVSEQYAFRVVDRAMAPEPDEDVKLPRLILMFGGPVVGLLLGCLLVLGVNVVRAWRAASLQ